MEWKIVEVSNTPEDGPRYDLRDARRIVLHNRTLADIMDYLMMWTPNTDVYMLNEHWYGVGTMRRTRRDKQLVAEGKLTQVEYDLLNGNEREWKDIFPDVSIDELYLRKRAAEFLWER